MSATIKAIDRDSVHRIHSGQVVLDLQGAVKELVENALDAGATSVDVRIKDHGLDTVEVVDNGSGIEEADWASIGLKHHTSKLPSLEELAQVSTFGFRGEALSALCALCESVTVVTATAETVPMGAVIKLGRDGRVLDDTGRVARQRGTTITLTGLFKPLPVRRKEFERTAKREYMKALGILTAYALVPAASTDEKGGVRIKVEAIGSGRGGKRNTVLSTDGRGALKSSVAAVWGAKALDGVTEVNMELDVEVDKAMARREGIAETSQTVHVSGLISSAAWGQGRTSADRQFTYINGRPCTLPKIVKALNETYKSFNTHQVPLAILDFQIPREGVDINVSPDKRTIFVHSEANLISSLRSGLETLFQPTRSSFAIGGASSSSKVTLVEATQPADDPGTDQETTPEPEDAAEASQESLPRRRTQRVPDLMDLDGEEELSTPSSSQRTNSTPLPRSSRRTRQPSPPPGPRLEQRTLDTTVASWSPKKRSAASAGVAGPSRARATGRNAQRNLRKQLAGYASQSLGVQDDDEDELESEQEEEAEEEPVEAEEVGEGAEDEEEPAPATAPSSPVSEASTMPAEADTRPEEPPVASHDLATDDEDGDIVMFEEIRPPSRSRNHASISVEHEANVAEDAQTAVEQPPEPARSPEPLHASTVDEPEDLSALTPPTNGSPTNGVSFAQPDAVVQEEPEAATSSAYRDEIQSTGTSGEATLRFDYARLQKRYAARRQRQATRTSRDAFTKLREGAVTKAAGVGNRDAQAAEAALSRVISKADFDRMQVLGQFNKGFIIARLRHSGEDGAPASDDLFIVDQHASDEKFNFETLQRTTVIKAQTLIKPRAMQLTAADELVAMENLDMLRLNGFEVAVDEDAPPGRGERVALKAMPVSKETTFDFTDLEQLLHLLGDSARPEGQMVRCTKARAMFAMRACRRSVMIGKSLTRAQMVTLLRNMGTIDQPWNCPHGRPTMRHLCTLNPRAPNKGRIDWSRVEL